MKPLTKKELKTIRIETNPDGFTIWMGIGRGSRWILDGSLIKKTGQITLGSQNNKYFTVADEDDIITLMKQ